MNTQINTLQVNGRQEWRNWLEGNHDQVKLLPTKKSVPDEVLIMSD